MPFIGAKVVMANLLLWYDVGSDNMIDEKLHIEKVDIVLHQAIQSGQLLKLWNGVGSEEPFLRWFRPPQYVRDWFSEASKFHDIGYRVGGTEEHQEAVDREFTKRCFDVVSRMPWLNRWRGLFWLQVCGDAVRNFGAFSFNTRDEPDYDLEKLIAEAG